MNFSYLPPVFTFPSPFQPEVSSSIYLYGAGGHASVIIDIITSLGKHVLGVFDDKPRFARLKSMEIQDGIRLLGDGFPQLDAPMIISVGNNVRRAELAYLFQNAQFDKAIHHSALVASTAIIDEGTVVLHGAIVQAGTKIGKHVLVNTAASIDHDNEIGDFAHISPHATLCGHVKVGEGTHIGAGAVVIPGIEIGKWSTIGAGAVVISDVPDYATVVGNPGVVIKTGCSPI